MSVAVRVLSPELTLYLCPADIPNKGAGGRAARHGGPAFGNGTRKPLLSRPDSSFGFPEPLPFYCDRLQPLLLHMHGQAPPLPPPNRRPTPPRCLQVRPRSRNPRYHYCVKLLYSKISPSGSKYWSQ